MMDPRPTQEAVTHEGQDYLDEPIQVKPTPERGSPIARSVAAAFGGRAPEPLVVGHERVKLRWLEPDGQGGLRPKQTTGRK